MEALVLVGHGSRLPYSKEMVSTIANKIREKNLYDIVEIGMMEFNEPTIPQAIKSAIDKGAKKIIVVPVFLAHGNHTMRDIPKMLGLVKEDENNGHDHHHHHHHPHPIDDHHHHHHHNFEPIELPDDVEIIYKEPLGPDDRIVEIVIERAQN